MFSQVLKTMIWLLNSSQKFISEIARNWLLVSKQKLNYCAQTTLHRQTDSKKRKLNFKEGIFSPFWNIYKHVPLGTEKHGYGPPIGHLRVKVYSEFKKKRINFFSIQFYFLKMNNTKKIADKSTMYWSTRFIQTIESTLRHARMLLCFC